MREKKPPRPFGIRGDCECCEHDNVIQLESDFTGYLRENAAIHRQERNHALYMVSMTSVMPSVRRCLRANTRSPHDGSKSSHHFLDIRRELQITSRMPWKSCPNIVVSGYYLGMDTNPPGLQEPSLSLI